MTYFKIGKDSLGRDVVLSQFQARSKTGLIVMPPRFTVVKPRRPAHPAMILNFPDGRKMPSPHRPDHGGR